MYRKTGNFVSEIFVQGGYLPYFPHKTVMYFVSLSFYKFVRLVIIFKVGTSLAVQWLRLHAYNAGGVCGFNPWLGN